MRHRGTCSVVGLARLSPAALLAQNSSGGAVAADQWKADPAHSAVTFRVRHLGITWVNGAFRQWVEAISPPPPS